VPAPPAAAPVAERLRAQLLTGPPAGSAAEVTRRLLAVQAQDPRGVRLSVRSRTSGLRAAELEAALGDRSLVVSWLNRGTLHLVTAQDYWWLHPLTTPQLATGSARRLAQEGVSPRQAEQGIEVVAAAVAQDGPLTRAELRERLDAAGVPTARQALVHVLMAATLRGHVVRGPVHGREQAFAAVADWLGEPPSPLDPDDALARLARRYLEGHGPADGHDLARWAGITLGAARRGLAAIGDETVDRPDGLVDLADRDAEDGVPPPRLLGPYDPLLLGWVSRAAWVGEHEGIVTTNGLFRPFALVGGRAAATWALSDGTLTLQPLERIRRDDLTALRADATDVLRYLGLPDRELVVLTP